MRVYKCACVCMCMCTCISGADIYLCYQYKARVSDQNGVSLQ